VEEVPVIKLNLQLPDPEYTGHTMSITTCSNPQHIHPLKESNKNLKWHANYEFGSKRLVEELWRL